jgi:hypothetical protein
MPEPAAWAAPLATNPATDTAVAATAVERAKDGIRDRYGAIARHGVSLACSDGVEGRAPKRLQDVVAVGIEAGDLEQGLDAALGSASRDERHEVDRPDDQVARHRGSARRTMGHHVGSTARDGLSKRSTML